ncbi:MAG: hypothetical protein A2499_01070 [Stygiobacter sp. RIFOXYC12_FULL_38_8]|nr:MAG: hypothetical protein A2X62_13445 [Stygiobacter sp. GWC2_38_9]OGU81888.1 MAG: hypothetical protein A2279_04470 [Stygiobacter sp. RIFOXYA12_FULL_38_9]OGV06133.1 MAG: hypothetical protein A2299_07990 [Stygiobacter sp. RIFOXYB2_FULL_37_11]OGV11372.1 MAG: hypothetical protein A2237_10725 [Stygiobacter sp. RIFOXYA2_FULL_38_8]OGV16802.1 MAG: hypothetical protein A2440_05525 [Stygiobacter sp. RIFOXYC2_FULL_38_25]OGV29409.1 MAG: hypothetical protein A2499_01070 [Stygiobacter sp. RIFOXYC12_FULL_
MFEKKDKKSIRNNTIATLLAAVILSIISYLGGIIPWLISVSSNIFKWLTTNISIPIWIFFVLILFPLKSFLAFVNHLRAKGKIEKTISNGKLNTQSPKTNNTTQKPGNNKPQLSSKDYNHDFIYNLKWRWSYSSNGSIINLVPFCPNCDFQVRPHRTSSFQILDNIGFRCEDCCKDIADFDHDYKVLEDKVIRVIQKNIRNDLWQSRIIKE